MRLSTVEKVLNIFLKIFGFFGIVLLATTYFERHHNHHHMTQARPSAEPVLASPSPAVTASVPER